MWRGSWPNWPARSCLYTFRACKQVCIPGFCSSLLVANTSTCEVCGLERPNRFKRLSCCLFLANSLSQPLSPDTTVTFLFWGLNCAAGRFATAAFFKTLAWAYPKSFTANLRKGVISSRLCRAVAWGMFKPAIAFFKPVPASVQAMTEMLFPSVFANDLKFPDWSLHHREHHVRETSDGEVSSPLVSWIFLECTTSYHALFLVSSPYGTVCLLHYLSEICLVCCVSYKQCYQFLSVQHASIHLPQRSHLQRPHPKILSSPQNVWIIRGWCLSNLRCESCLQRLHQALSPRFHVS